MIKKYIPESYTVSADSVTIVNGVVAPEEQTFTVTTGKYTHTIKVLKGAITDFSTDDKV